jgi:resuscitation-promoting factor RpfB
VSTKGTAAVMMGVGTLFVYAGARGYSILTAMQNVIKGQSPNAGQSTQMIGASAAEDQSLTGTPTGGSATSNRALGQMLAAAKGWTGAQWTALDALWTRESGWDNTAKNPSSGAYGIPQALPPTKLPASGQESGGSNASAQITWGLDYIASEYGNPVNAEAHENAVGWY